MSKTPAPDSLKTKVIPGLTDTYQIVSLPYWAWYWLEDFMQMHKISYQGIYDTFGANNDISQTLHQLAELHHEYAMREVYSLCNDNEPEEEQIVTRLKTRENLKQVEPNLPKIYKLFGFMPCATSLEAVWERRHYEDSNKIN